MQSFKSLKDVERHANELLNKTFTVDIRGYNKTSISISDLGYRFQFDNAKRRLGVCRYSRKIIGLSKPLTELNLDNGWQINNTLLHEIAHAIAFHMDRFEGKGHGWLWQEVALAIGCDGKRCYDSSSVNKPKSKYTLTCPTCDKESPMHKRPKRSYACGDCCTGGYDPQHKLVIQQNY